MALGSVLAPLLSSCVTSAESLELPVLSLLIYNQQALKPVSEVVLTMQGEKGGQTLSKLSLCQFPVLPAWTCPASH